MHELIPQVLTTWGNFDKSGEKRRLSLPRNDVCSSHRGREDGTEHDIVYSTCSKMFVTNWNAPNTFRNTVSDLLMTLRVEIV